MTNSSLINKASKLQDKFIKTTQNYTNATQLNKLYKDNNILKINDIIQLESCKCMYKLKKNLLPIEFFLLIIHLYLIILETMKFPEYLATHLNYLTIAC